MSVFIGIADKVQRVATNKGWGDVRRLAESLGDKLALSHLCENGWLNEARVPELQAELARIDPPSKDVSHTLQRLAEIASGSNGEPLVVSNGLSV